MRQVHFTQSRRAGLAACGAAVGIFLPLLSGCGCGVTKDATVPPAVPAAPEATSAPVILTPQGQTSSAPGTASSSPSSVAAYPSSPGTAVQANSTTQATPNQPSVGSAYQPPTQTAQMQGQPPAGLPGGDAPQTGQASPSAPVSAPGPDLRPDQPDADGKVLMPSTIPK